MPRPILRLFAITIVARTPFAAVGPAADRAHEGADRLVRRQRPGRGRIVGRPRALLALGRPARRPPRRRPPCSVSPWPSALRRLAPSRLLPHGAPLGVLVACSALAGATTPPIGACMRTLYSTLLEGDALHRAYALESAALELTYIAGPVLMLAIASMAGTAPALIVGRRGLRGGDRRVLGHAREPLLASRARGCDGPTRGRAALARHADDHHRDRACRRNLRRRRGRCRRRLPGRRCQGRHRGAAGDLGARLAASEGLRLLAPARRPMRRAGSRCCSPRWGSGTSRLSRCPRRPPWRRCCSSPAPRSPRCSGPPTGSSTAWHPSSGQTEAFAWLTTAVGIGLAGGSALAGALVDAGGPAAGFATAAAAGLVACAVTAARRASLAPAGTVPSVA